jgi:hypothetical protein
MKKDQNSDAGRQEAYPRPTTTDQQLKNQPEFIDQQPDDFDDKSISDLPVGNPARNEDEKDEDQDRS